MLLRVCRELGATYREYGSAGCRKLCGYYLAKIGIKLGGSGCQCPICGWTGRRFLPLFTLPWGIIREAAVCPGCASFERHRAYLLFYRKFFSGGGIARFEEMIHFAPEGCLEGILSASAKRYRKSNYQNASEGELSLDLRDLDLPDESVDVLVMNYVLSCMPEDRKALRSMWRVLKEEGVVLAGEGLVPGTKSVELAPPEYGGRHRHFGMVDIVERFAPFEVSIIDVTAELEETQRVRFGLNSPEHVLLLRKRGNRPQAIAHEGVPA